MLITIKTNVHYINVIKDTTITMRREEISSTNHRYVTIFNSFGYWHRNTGSHEERNRYLILTIDPNIVDPSSIKDVFGQRVMDIVITQIREYQLKELI